MKNISVISFDNYILIYCADVFLGIIIGLGHNFIQWPTFDRFWTGVSTRQTELLKPSNWTLRSFLYDHRRRQRKANEAMIPYIVIGGIIFYILGYISNGTLFGLNYRENFSLLETETYIRSGPAIMTALVGIVFFSLYLGIMFWFDIGVILRGFVGYALAFFVSLSGIFWATALSGLFFNKTPFFMIAVFSRVIGFIILTKLSRSAWRVFVLFFTILSINSVLLISYILVSINT